MPKIISQDGTSLATRHEGKGLPLVLVHGTGASSARWMTILPALAEHFSVNALDRRGRGDSSDGPAYALEREFEDVAAVVDSLAEPTYLLGHSYGAICALEAALLTRQVRKLILYEPPIGVEGVAIYPEGSIDRLKSMLARGDREGVLTTFMREIVRMPAHEFEVFRASPAWPARLAAAHTLPRELRAQQQYRFAASRFTGFKIPTRLLVGGDSPPFLTAAVELVAASLPGSQTVVLPGQQHIAMDTAPELFLGAVLDFFESAD